ncbi:MAG: dienelactone hydrolase family protein [Acidimicrobiales bacterium]
MSDPSDLPPMIPFGRRPSSAGQAYLVRPGDDGEGTGPGVLVLHSWWGLTPGIKDFCNRLCDEGFVVLAPDLLDGKLPETAAEAEVELSESDPNATAALIISSTVALRSACEDPSGPVAVVGFSMGASWALWAATRQPDSFSKVVAYYGSQTIDFSDLRAQVQGHFPEHDALVSPDDIVLLEADLFELGHEPEMWHYEGVHHWFAEPGVEGFHDEPAAALAWERTVEFLTRA